MTPYAAPEVKDVPNQQTSIIGKAIAVMDLLIGAGIAFAVSTYPIDSLVVLLVMWPVAYGLFRMRVWGWWAGMALHGLVLVGSTIVYTVMMIDTVGDFGRPRSHMAIITPEGIAVMMTIVYVVVLVLTGLPVIGLWTRGCRRAYGVLKSKPAVEAEN